MELMQKFWPKNKQFKRFLVYLLGMNVIGLAIRFFIATAALLLMLLSNVFEIDVSLVSILSLVAAVALFAVFSPLLRNYYEQADFVGSWEYENIPDLEPDEATHDQAPTKIRIAEISHDKDGVLIEGWRSDAPKNLHFETKMSLISGFGKKRGRLIYRYESPIDTPPTKRFTGLVEIEWKKKSRGDVVTEMDGRFYGESSKTMGVVKFRRIKKRESQENILESSLA
ncbi:hypothetical protein L4C36_12100 [Photobacterium japonica]|uniref:hypothetical protein n=1 Tax=Photobacterium japonica TaxID=2910235 RepID=UPI003D10B2B3